VVGATCALGLQRRGVGEPQREQRAQDAGRHRALAPADEVRHELHLRAALAAPPSRPRAPLKRRNQAVRFSLAPLHERRAALTRRPSTATRARSALQLGRGPTAGAQRQTIGLGMG